MEWRVSPASLEHRGSAPCIICCSNDGRLPEGIGDIATASIRRQSDDYRAARPCCRRWPGCRGRNHQGREQRPQRGGAMKTDNQPRTPPCLGVPFGPNWPGLRCGAKTRKGTPCQGPAMANGRCRMHGGKSTGPRTPEGLERSRRGNWKHGRRSANAVAERKLAMAIRREISRIIEESKAKL